jgi:OmpA-OmpF porin, OOP family
MKNGFQFRLICFWGCLCITLSIDSLAQSVGPFNPINSPADEQSPVLSPDGRLLYFTIAGHSQNIGGKSDLGDIWVSMFLDGKWQKPIHGGRLINDVNYNAVAGVSSDGRKLFLLGHYSPNGVPTSQGISFSEKLSSGDWSSPKKINIPYFFNRSNFLHGQVKDSIFVFAADSYSSVGAEDIYVSRLRSGRWTEPIHLGKTINTKLQEWSPSISADGQTLYFASNGQKGQGSFDLFSSSRLDDTWTNWSTPMPLSGQVNSDARELFYREGSGKSLYTSTRDSNGYGDIHEIQDLDQVPMIDTLIKIVENKYEAATSNTVMLTGKVIDSKTKAGILVSLQFKSDTLLSTYSTSKGLYEVKIPATKLYTIELQKTGYVTIIERLDIQTIQLKSLEMNYQLQPVEVGIVVNLKSVLFTMGTTTLLEESYAELDAMVDFMKANPKVEIELEGHTDNRGDAKKNVLLSKERVNRIKLYLVSKGISSKRIRGRGFGGSKPIATNDTEEARKLNRRVDFLIIKS